jgi:hypothetical protein
MCCPSTGRDPLALSWEMSSAIVDAAASSGGSRMTSSARIIEGVGRFATWKVCYV